MQVVTGGYLNGVNLESLKFHPLWLGIRIAKVKLKSKFNIRLENPFVWLVAETLGY